MPWGRFGDNAHEHPRLLATLEHPDADERSLDEVYGFFMRCTGQSAGHLTDYVVSRGVVMQASPARWRTLVGMCLFAGLMTEVVIDGPDGQPRQAYKLFDEPEFVHIRTKEEVDWERQRKQDNANPAVTIPVRMRDGDGCRYCGLVVNWRARTGRLAGTYDHREPGKPATVDTLVVACRRCNSVRQDRPDADRDTPLLTIPSRPYYSPTTVSWIESNDWARRNGITPPQAQPEKEAGTPTRGTGGSRPSDTPPTQGAGTTPRPRPAQPERSNGPTPPPFTGPQTVDSPLETDQPTASTAPPSAADQQETCRIQQEPAGSRSAGAGQAGTGRDGSGRAGTDRGGSGGPPASTAQPPGARRRRGRRRRPHGQASPAGVSPAPEPGGKVTSGGAPGGSS